jgi:hypothetical protein
MQRRGVGPSKATTRAAVVVALLTLGSLAGLLGWAEARGDNGSCLPGGGLSSAALTAGGDPEFVDPWELTPTGERLGPGFSLEDEGLPILP